MTEPLDFKIAFQGGGAKFFTLLAAIEALQSARDVGQIEFSHIIGSSAGGLAALLLGLNREVKDFRRILGGERIKSSISKLTELNVGYIDLWGLARGGSLVGEEVLKSLFLEILVDFTDSTEDQVPEFSAKTSVVITNLKTSNSEIVDLNGKRLRDIASDLLHTCAIPFVFKGYKSKQDPHLVDGGLFENFPTSELALSNYPPGRIIGVTFEKPPKSKSLDTSDLKQYLSEIVSAAIDSNISPSLKNIHEENVIELPNAWDTLEIEEALKSLDTARDNHQLVRSVVSSKLSAIISREKQKESFSSLLTRATIPQTFDQVRDAATTLFECRKSLGLVKRAYVYLELQSQQLSHKTEIAKTEDYYFQKIYYKVPEDGIECLNIVISEFEDESEFSLFADFDVKDELGVGIKHTVFPLRRIEGTMNYRSLAVFFEERLFPKDTEWVCLTQRELLPEQFSELKETGWDFLEFGSLHGGSFEELQIFVGMPHHLRDSIVCEVAKRQYDEDSAPEKLISGSSVDISGEITDAIGPGYSAHGLQADSEVSGENLFSVLIYDQRKISNFDEHELYDKNSTDPNGVFDVS